MPPRRKSFSAKKKSVSAEDCLGFFFPGEQLWYYAFPKSKLTMKQRKMAIGEVTRMRWDDGIDYDAQCIAIDTKKIVDDLIDDLIAGSKILADVLREKDAVPAVAQAPSTPKTGGRRSTKQAGTSAVKTPNKRKARESPKRSTKKAKGSPMRQKSVEKEDTPVPVDGDDDVQLINVQPIVQQPLAAAAGVNAPAAPAQPVVVAQQQVNGGANAPAQALAQADDAEDEEALLGAFEEEQEEEQFANDTLPEIPDALLAAIPQAPAAAVVPLPIVQPWEYNNPDEIKDSRLKLAVKNFTEANEAWTRAKWELEDTKQTFERGTKEWNDAQRKAWNAQELLRYAKEGMTQRVAKLKRDYESQEASTSGN